MRNYALPIIMVLVATPTAAVAQPAVTPPVLQLMADEHALLERGEIGEGAQIGGAAVSIVFGLGTGHAIQGRWKERGWIFTFGELAGLALAAIAASESDLDEDLVAGLAIVGWTSFLGLHVWEVVDAVTEPRQHNRRVRELKRRAAQRPPAAVPFVAPLPERHGVMGGVLLRF